MPIGKVGMLICGGNTSHQVNPRTQALDYLRIENTMKSGPNHDKENENSQLVPDVLSPERESRENSVVADAVDIEPVSASKFPVNREKNREFFNFQEDSQILTQAGPMISGVSDEIPCAG